VKGEDFKKQRTKQEKSLSSQKGKNNRLLFWKDGRVTQLPALGEGGGKYRTDGGEMENAQNSGRRGGLT